MTRLKDATYDLLDALEETAKFRLITRIFDESQPMTRAILVDTTGAVCLVGASLPKYLYSQFYGITYLGSQMRSQLFPHKVPTITTEEPAASAWDESTRNHRIPEARQLVQSHILSYIQDHGGI